MTTRAAIERLIAQEEASLGVLAANCSAESKTPVLVHRYALGKLMELRELAGLDRREIHEEV